MSRLRGRRKAVDRGGNPRARQRGIAMLVAILLVALGTIIAAAVAYESAMTARRGTANFSFDEAVLVSQGAEALAGYGLRTVMQMSKTTSSSGGGAPDIYLAQPWAQPVGPLEVVPGVTLEAQLEDMQGRFNLNWLVSSTQGPNLGKPDPVMVEAFRQLLQLSQVDPKWADMVVDWIDRDSNPQTQGAEDSAYLGQNPPYLAANQYITSTSELLALPGFGRDNYLKIQPYISALPPGTSLNVCTAPGPVLDAFNKGTVNFSDPEALAKNRANAPGCFPTKSDLANTFEQSTLSQIQNRLQQTSSYFRLQSLVTIGTAEFNLYSLLYMDNQGYFLHPIQRSFSPD
jgi:general secretion pathway protein K